MIDRLRSLFVALFILFNQQNTTAIDQQYFKLSFIILLLLVKTARMAFSIYVTLSYSCFLQSDYNVLSSAYYCVK